MSLPDRVLLISDVVDSTRLNQRLGDAAMASAWARHDGLARGLLSARGGREVDRTDGFLLIFETVEGALDWAREFHAGMAAISADMNIDFHARVGVHVGPALLIETPAEARAGGAKPLELEGLAKPLAARVASVAGPGQTLLSAAAAARLGPAAAAGLVPRGTWALKGVEEPVALLEAVAPGQDRPPPVDAEKAWRVVRVDGVWRPARELPHGLPAEVDGFFGRERALRALEAATEGGARLITLLGPAGVGKSRLGLRLGWRLLGELPGGAWRAALADARARDAALLAVARALDVPLGGGDPAAQLGHAIAARGRCLLLLDDADAVAEPLAGLLSTWLAAAPEARFVVTSRARLGVPGERAWEVEPLPEEDALAMLVARGRERRPDLSPQGADLAELRAAAALLDGLPLAIELCASRLRVLPPAALRARLHDRLRLLAEPAGRAARQATLRGAIDGSWELLEPWARAAFARLSVFEGGFSLEAAEALIGADPAAPDPLDVLQGLVDRSLLRAGADGRFGILEVLRLYAAEKLRAEGAFPGSGPAAEVEAFARHGAFYANLQETREEARLILELGNLAAAVRRAAAAGWPEVGSKAAMAAALALELTGPSSLKTELLERARATPGLDRIADADLARGLASSYTQQGRAVEALALLAQVEGPLLALGDPDRLARLENARARALCESGRPDEAFAAWDRALALLGPQDRSRTRTVTLADRGAELAQRGRYPEGRATLEEGLALARATRWPRQEASILGNLALIAHREGRLEAARRGHAEALALLRVIGDRRGEANKLTHLGMLAETGGDVEDAERLLREAVAAHRAIGNRRLEGSNLVLLSTLLRELGRLDEVEGPLAAGLAIHREVGNRRSEGIALANLGHLRAAQGRTGEARALFESALALHRATRDPISEALTQGALGLAEARLGEGERGLARIAAAEASLRAIGDELSLIPLQLVAAEALAALGRGAEARAALAEARRLAEARGAPLRGPLARRLDALVASLEGTDEIG